jgi:hypothetical protein
VRLRPFERAESMPLSLWSITSVSRPDLPSRSLYQHPGQRKCVDEEACQRERSSSTARKARLSPKSPRLPTGKTTTFGIHQRAGDEEDGNEGGVHEERGGRAHVPDRVTSPASQHGRRGFSPGGFSSACFAPPCSTGGTRATSIIRPVPQPPNTRYLGRRASLRSKPLIAPIVRRDNVNYMPLPSFIEVSESLEDYSVAFSIERKTIVRQIWITIAVVGFGAHFWHGSCGIRRHILPSGERFHGGCSGVNCQPLSGGPL